MSDSIRLHHDSIKIKVAVFTGKEGDYFVSLSPSLNVSGYGKTKREAKVSFQENIILFCQDLLALPKKQIEIELKALGFIKEKFHNKNFAKVYVDENGDLQNFEEGTVEREIHEETT